MSSRSNALHILFTSEKVALTIRMFLLLPLFYRIIVPPASEQESGIYRYTALPNYFRFQEGGTYNIDTVKNSTGRIISGFAFVCTRDEFENWNALPTGCDIQGPLPLSGNITKAGDWQFLVGELEEDAYVTLHNPNSFLNATEQPCLFEKPLAAALCALLLVFWIINWVMNFTTKLTVHTCLTMTFLISVVFMIIHFCEYWHFHQSDEDSGITEARIVIKFIMDTLMFASMLMAAKGWSIVKTSLTKVEIIVCFVVAVIFTVPSTVMDNVLLIERWHQYLVVGFTLVGMLVYCKTMMRSIEQSMSYVIAHMMVISEEGYDIRTTPVYRKYIIFRGMGWGLVIFLLVKVTISSVGELAEMDTWIVQMLMDLGDIGWLIAAAILFRLKKQNVNGYMTIGEDLSEPRQLMRDDIAGLNMESELIAQGTRVWEDGMNLPSQPIFLDDLDTTPEKKEASTSQVA